MSRLGECEEHASKSYLAMKTQQTRRRGKGKKGRNLDNRLMISDKFLIKLGIIRQAEYTGIDPDRNALSKVLTCLMEARNAFFDLYDEFSQLYGYTGSGANKKEKQLCFDWLEVLIDSLADMSNKLQLKVDSKLTVDPQAAELRKQIMDGTTPLQTFPSVVSPLAMAEERFSGVPHEEKLALYKAAPEFKSLRDKIANLAVQNVEERLLLLYVAENIGLAKMQVVMGGGELAQNRFLIRALEAGLSAARGNAWAVLREDGCAVDLTELSQPIALNNVILFHRDTAQELALKEKRKAAHRDTITEWKSDEAVAGGGPVETYMALKSGYLFKTGAVNKGYKKRYFYLYADRLQYFKEVTKDQAKRAGEIMLTAKSTLTLGGVDVSKEHSFTLKVGDRGYGLATETQAQLTDWYHALERVITNRSSGGKTKTAPQSAATPASPPTSSSTPAATAPPATTNPPAAPTLSADVPGGLPATSPVATNGTGAPPAVSAGSPANQPGPGADPRGAPPPPPGMGGGGGVVVAAASTPSATKPLNMGAPPPPPGGMGAPPPPPVVQSQPPVWSKNLDAASGVHFYFNRITNTSEWVKPADYDGPA